MFENVFVILRTGSDGDYRYQLIETRWYTYLSSSTWENVTSTLRKYVMKYGNEYDFFAALEGIENRKSSESVREKTMLECEINGDAFDYDIDRIIRQALYDRKYGNTPPVRLPKTRVLMGI